MRIRCPNGCKPETETPFYYAPGAFSRDEEGVKQGILAFADGEPSDRWEDGTAGIPPVMMDMLRGGWDLPHCVVCREEAENY